MSGPQTPRVVWDPQTRQVLASLGDVSGFGDFTGGVLPHQVELVPRGSEAARPGRCASHPPRMIGGCSPLVYACEHDAGHAGMHRDGSMEWSQ